MKDSRLLEILREVAAFRKLIFTDRDIELPISINKTQRGVLMYIAFNGPVLMNEVSERFSLEKGSFTQVADSLENLLLIERKRCEKDRRKIYLEITKKGREIAKKIQLATDARIESLLSTLPDKDRDVFLNSLESVTRYIDIIRRKKDC